MEYNYFYIQLVGTVENIVNVYISFGRISYVFTHTQNTICLVHYNLLEFNLFYIFVVNQCLKYFKNIINQLIKKQIDRSHENNCPAPSYTDLQADPINI